MQTPAFRENELKNLLLVEKCQLTARSRHPVSNEPPRACVMLSGGSVRLSAGMPSPGIFAGNSIGNAIHVAVKCTTGR